MLDLYDLPTNTDVYRFYSTTADAETSWQLWSKPRGKTMMNIFLMGCGGNGGTGVIGSNSTAAGGGGGGSGAQAMLTVPLHSIPDFLYLYLLGPGSGGGYASYISVGQEITTANGVLLVAKAGGNGFSASGATPGNGGAGGTITAIANCPLAAVGNYNFLAGQAGIAGSAAGVGANLTLPTTGLRCTGGTGGGGLGTSGSQGNIGGSFNVPSTLPDVFPAHPGGVGGSAATTPPYKGSHGRSLKLGYFYGGTGGGSTHGSATGAGLVQSSGGNGSFGSGGGGIGGALTGSTAGVVGKGGSALCIITCW